MRRWLILLVSLSNVGCTSFVPVRSARVAPGLKGRVAATMSTPPGDEAAWFWGLDCVSDCDRVIPSLSAAAAYGIAPEKGVAYEMGVGVSGVYPYVEGFVQLQRESPSLGVGGRIGIPQGSWREDALYVAYEFSDDIEDRVVMTTSLFRHHGGTPNAATRGSVLGVGQGLGLVGGAFELSLALIVGRIQGETEGRHSSSTTAFLVLGVGTVLSRQE